MSGFAFDAHVTAALFDRQGQAAFALGDGTVRFEGGAQAIVHDGAVLCAALHPSGEGVVTGGDDGQLVWSQPDSAVKLAGADGRWIDAVAAAPESGLIAFAAGREAVVLDVRDPAFRRRFAHERTVAGLAFDPKGRRLACATYGGAALWFARIEGQKPTFLKWAGSHIGVIWSPDGRFLITAMQDNQLHGWRVADAKDMRMGGYPAKIRDMTFMDGGRLLATAGANGAVLWPFAGANGPMGREAAEVGHEDTTVVVKVAATPGRDRLAAGTADGRVWVADVRTTAHRWLKAERGAPISALAMSADGARLAWGDEDGQAAVVALA